MMAVHRGPRSFEESDGKYSLTKEEDGHPLGTKLNIHGSNSSIDSRTTASRKSIGRWPIPAWRHSASRLTWRTAS